jgi:hypothetical protein
MDAPFLKKIILLTAILILWICSGFSQFKPATSDGIKSRIVDAETHTSISNAMLFNTRSNNRSASDKNGRIALRRVFITDSIVISTVGYETAYFSASELAKMDTVFLRSRSSLKSEYGKYDESAYLYDVFAKSAKTVSNKSLEAKTYFSLESYSDSTQLEWMEGYYNGIFKGYEFYNLNLKNGRVALLADGLNYFLSLESSKVQRSFRIFEENYHFPKNPFEMSKKDLKLIYKLRLSNSFKNEDNNTILVVDFKPYKDASYFFEGRAWLDSLSGELLKTSLQCLDAKIHPYSLELANDELVKMDLFLSNNFKKVEGKMYVESIEYNYHLHYENWKKERTIMSMHNRLYAYNYKEKFEPAYYDFGRKSYNDYMKVNAAPYNAFFWEYMDEFSLFNRKELNLMFILKVPEDEKMVFLGNSKPIYRLYSKTYKYWRSKRLFFEDSGMKRYNDDVLSVLARDMYTISINIYLDINYLNDSLQCISRSIFDPYHSYYYFDPDSKSTAFLNMYFDCVEINRREMDALLKVQGMTKQKAKRIYRSRMVELGRKSVVFFRELDRGNDKEGMIKWNAFIKAELGIDNWELFELDYEFD